MLYTVADIEWVLNGVPSAKVESKKKCEMTVAGGLVEGSIFNGKITVSRLISTNPGMYLDKRYTPGAVWPGKSREE
ncbi:MAG: hypothetical protein E7487_10420 [Ruminococcaceae bacterium]|nr:hypothetical protein [Oscillospiraceae bacterium]